MRIPYTGPLPPPRLIPRNANTETGAIAALSKFLTAPPRPQLNASTVEPESTVVLTGAGISVASGLADYRGTNGTYRLNKTYRPIYYHEFVSNHEARKRYWARSFLGWSSLHKAQPNAAHWAIKHLGELGLVKQVITQNVDSFHPMAHPELPTLELHGYLRRLVCTSCHNELPRQEFQDALARLNPAWYTFLQEAIASGALGTEDPETRRAKGVKSNPDGDVDVPGAPYSTFRYPACPTCLAQPLPTSEGHAGRVDIDNDGGWLPTSTGGILKPGVVMFGESIRPDVKTAAENAICGSGRLLVVGTSLATYSAWRLARRAKERGMPIGILNLGGVRGEEAFFEDLPPSQQGEAGVRAEWSSDRILPELVRQLGRLGLQSRHRVSPRAEGFGNSPLFKDMMS